MRTRQFWTRVIIAITLALSGRLLQAQDQGRPAVAPSAPSGLTYLVSGRNVSLFWTHSTGPFTHYVIEAGATPGTTFFSYPTSANSSSTLLTQLISAFSTTGVGAGNYYVRVRGANGSELGAATPDIVVPVTEGCQRPGPPADFSAIIRGTSGWLQWSPGAGGLPTSYTLVASSTPGGPALASFPTGQNYLNVGGVPAATYYVRVLASNACGQGSPSSELTVVSPSNTPARTPNPLNGGRLALPFVLDTVRQVAAQNPGLLQASCPNPNSKYTLNPFLNAVVDRLRQIDQRFGYNSKPTRGPADNGGQPVVVAGDEFAYHYGADAPEGSPNVHLVDIVFSHCGTPQVDYRVFTNGEFGRWTGAGRF